VDDREVRARRVRVVVGAGPRGHRVGEGAEDRVGVGARGRRRGRGADRHVVPRSRPARVRRDEPEVVDGAGHEPGQRRGNSVRGAVRAGRRVRRWRAGAVGRRRAGLEVIGGRPPVGIDRSPMVADAVVTALAAPVVTEAAAARALFATRDEPLGTGPACARSACARDSRTTSALAGGTPTAASTATTHPTSATGALRAARGRRIAACENVPSTLRPPRDRVMRRRAAHGRNGTGSRISDRGGAWSRSSPTVRQRAHLPQNKPPRLADSSTATAPRQRHIGSQRGRASSDRANRRDPRHNPTDPVGDHTRLSWSIRNGLRRRQIQQVGMPANRPSPPAG